MAELSKEESRSCCVAGWPVLNLSPSAWPSPDREVKVELRRLGATRAGSSIPGLLGPSWSPDPGLVETPVVLVLLDVPGDGHDPFLAP